MMPSQTEIAGALGLAKSRITALKNRGMPVDSVAAAKAWRAENVRPVMHRRPELVAMAKIFDRLGERFSFAGPDVELRVAARLGKLAPQDFDHLICPLRAFMRLIPPADRQRLELPDEIWERLLGAALVAELEEARDPLNDDDALACEDGLSSLYSTACGELAFT